MVITQLDNAGNAVASTYNTYDFVHPSVVLPTVNAVVVKNDMEVLGFSQYPRYFQLYFYNLTSQWCPLIESAEIVYNQQAGGDITKSVASITRTQYANFFPRKTIQFSTTGSNATTCRPPACSPVASGSYYINEYLRAEDFNNGSTTATPDLTTTPGMLRNAGMTATVIEQTQYSSTSASGASPTYLGATITEYKLDNGHLLPYTTYSTPARISSFTPATTTQVAGNWKLNRDTNYQLASTITGYSTDARPINSLNRDGIPQATIWGYGHTLPIATVTNGAAALGNAGTGLNATAAHTSFEENGTNGTDGDGWQIPLNFSNTEAKTGIRSARIIISQNPYGAGKSLTLTSGANRHGKMVYSCWVKVPAAITTPVSLNLVVAGQGLNTGWRNAYYQIAPGQDWQYVEKVVDLDEAVWNGGITASDDLTLIFYPWCTGGTELLFDEVRIHRADAMMQTMTYAPLIGKTSSTDPSGVTTYYTYDSDNNARLVLNQKHDIVQRSQQLLIEQKARPSAEFSSPAVSTANCAVPFTAEYGSCTTGTTFNWNFGDGSTAANSGATQSHSYAQPGTYNVSLLVTNQDKGAARITKTVTITEPYHTEIEVRGNTNVNLCQEPNPAPVVLTALVPGACQGTMTYRWERSRNGGAWATVGTTNSFTQPVANGSYALRCIVGIAGVGDNAGSPNLQTITITGYYANGVVKCDDLPTPAKTKQTNQK